MIPVTKLDDFYSPTVHRFKLAAHLASEPERLKVKLPG